MISYSHCEEVRDEFSALLDGELSGEELDAVESHLSQCADCLRALDGMKQVDNLFTGMEGVRAPDDFEDRVLRTVRPKLLRFSLGPVAKKRLIGYLAAASVLWIVGAGVATVYFGGETERFDMAARETSSPSVAEVQRATSVSESAVAADSRVLRLEGLSGRDAQRAGGRGRGNIDSAGNIEQARGIQVADKISAAPVEALMGEEAAGAIPPKQIGKDVVLFDLNGDGAVSEPTGGTDQDADDRQLGAVRQERLIAGVVGDESTETQQVARSSNLPIGASTENVQAYEAKKLTEARRRQTFFANEPEAGKPTLGLGRGAESLAVEAMKKDKKEEALPWTLEERDGGWFEKGYAKEPTTVLKRESAELEELIAKHPAVAKLLAKKAKVVFRVEGKWYTLNAPTESKPSPSPVPGPEL